MSGEREVLHVDTAVKAVGIIASVVVVVLASYLHFLSMISDLKDRIVAAEKDIIMTKAWCSSFQELNMKASEAPNLPEPLANPENPENI